MARVSFEVPDDVMQAVSATPEEFGCVLRLAAAMHWYGRGELTMGSAAEVAGLDLREFLTALSRNKRDIFAVRAGELQEELALLAERRTQGDSGG